MVEFTKERLLQLLEGFRRKKILILGDLMLDRYLWGRVTRISPEAPVPIVEIESESSRLGGAANVGSNIAALGAVPLLVGVIGKDNSGGEILSIMREQGFPTEGVMVDDSRPTTVKTRVIAHNQHVVRTDRESRRDIPRGLQERILHFMEERMGEADALIIQDYNKGVVTGDLIPQVIQLARQGGKIVAVDPKFDHFFDFKHATVFKPNRKEVEVALGTRLDSVETLRKVGEQLLKRLESQCLVITLGEDGMAVFESDGQMTRVPTRARRVHDVSGAGDTVISTLALSLVAGATFKEAATLANYAAGIVCGEVGVVPITSQKILDEFNNYVWAKPTR